MYIIIFLSLSILIGIVAMLNNISNNKMYHFTKPIPLIILISLVLYYIIIPNPSDYSNYYFLGGLILGLLGDIFLLKKGFFIPGLLAFLTGHIFYIVYFLNKITTVNPIIVILFSIITVIYAAVFFIKLPIAKKKIFTGPVILYMGAITFMVILAFNYNFTVSNSFYLFSIGSVLFYISDAVLAYDKLIYPNKYLAIPILLTYFIGQTILTAGVMLINGVLMP